MTEDRTATSGTVTSRDELRALYGEPLANPLMQHAPRLFPSHLEWIERCPFMLLATADRDGQPSVTPRGDAPGFVMAIDRKTLVFPDRTGNRQINALLDILENNRVAMIFLIPGVRETLRVRGRARITTDESMLAMFPEHGKPPRTAVVVTVDEVYMHCGKALVRSKLWDPASAASAETVPSTGTIFREVTSAPVEAGEIDAELEHIYRTEL
jgi:PPOX class probable FMN-dependent enzyme